MNVASTVNSQTVRLFGRIKAWQAKKGWGLIESEDRTFFARAAEFKSELRISAGMKVEFTFTPGIEHPGHWPPATDIRVKA